MLFSEEQFRKLVRGEKKGLGAAICRILLFVVACGYSVVVRFRNFLFDRGWKHVEFLDVPVVSVGNISMGGTGKTPLIVLLARYFEQQGKHPGLLSRGYKSLPTDTAVLDEKSRPYAQYLHQNDEGRELAILLPGIPHFQSPRRTEAARSLLRFAPETDILLLDDAFQHRRTGRSIDIVLIDALSPPEDEQVFPRGFLREPLCGLRRADILLLTRANLVDDETRHRQRERLQRQAPNAVFAAVGHEPVAFHRRGENPVPFSLELPGNQSERYFAFCGIGNPVGFQKMLEKNGIYPVGLMTFPDHCHYAPQDLEKLTAAAREQNATALLTTMKDFVKIPQTTENGPSGGLSDDLPVIALEISLRFLEGEDFFWQRLSKT